MFRIHSICFLEVYLKIDTFPVFFRGPEWPGYQNGNPSREPVSQHLDLF